MLLGVLLDNGARDFSGRQPTLLLCGRQLERVSGLADTEEVRPGTPK
jgi:hypothetical protein